MNIGKPFSSISWGLLIAIIDIGIELDDFDVLVDFIGYLLGGIRELALLRLRYNLAELADSRRLAYIAITIGTLLLGHLARDFHHETLVAMGAIAQLFMLSLVLHTIYRANFDLVL